MRLFFLFVLLQFSVLTSSFAQPDEYLSDQLMLDVVTHDGNPKSWLQFYIPNNQRKIGIKAKFDIKHVRAAIITDMNAVEKRCSSNALENLVFFSFEPSINLNHFTTRISKPCIYKRTAKLKLRIATKDDKRFFKTFEFSVHPNSKAAN